MIINKEIEEMAEVIANMEERNAHYYDEHMQVQEAFADCYNIAEALYNADYRKVSDDTIMLTKEEYERLKNSRNIRVVTKHEEDDYEICIPVSDYDEMLKQERKETAQEILDEVSKHYGGGWLVALYNKYGLEV